MTGPGWYHPADGAALSHRAAIRRLAAADYVLLGERHDRAADHRWQMHVAAGLAAHRPLVMGFEMFPARLDPVLADWAAGDLTEDSFLSRAEWAEVWGFPPELYLPLFRFCRDLAIPMVGLNCRRALVGAVGAKGWAAIPASDREGLGTPRPSPPAYRRFIFDLTGGARPGRIATAPDDPAFDRFVRAQEVWDRAFAERLFRAAQRPGTPLTIGIIGKGHLKWGGGVPWQLADLGATNVQVAIAQSPEDPPLPAGAADLACRLPPPVDPVPKRR